jgi:hypothetical protein
MSGGWTTNGPQMTATACCCGHLTAHAMITTNRAFAQVSAGIGWSSGGASSRIPTCAHGSGGSWLSLSLPAETWFVVVAGPCVVRSEAKRGGPRRVPSIAARSPPCCTMIRTHVRSVESIRRTGRTFCSVVICTPCGTWPNGRPAQMTFVGWRCFAALRAAVRPNQGQG